MGNRSGSYIPQPTGYKAFIPKALPPDPAIKYDEELQVLLSKADRHLARLDGIVTVLPNPDLFISMYIKKEALLSSQIEGTQASLEGVLEFEADIKPKDDINHIKEVINYMEALDYGMKRLKELPMSLRLIKEIHKVLLETTRGSHKDPGEFKKYQNWIGPAGAVLNEASYIPPPPAETLTLMGDLEKFVHKEDNIPPLIKIALIHSQFETIHPFLDGNGRMGRLLITFYLFWTEILSNPVLYLSFYFKKNKQIYYDRLMKVRIEGEWEEWIKFFLKGIIETCSEAISAAKEIIALKGALTKQLHMQSIASIHAVGLLELLFELPLIDTKLVVEKLKISRVAALSLINKFEKAAILSEVTGKKRYKKYIFSSYVAIIRRGTEQ